MNLYLVSRPRIQIHYDEYDAFVVAAPSTEEALSYHPDGKRITECDKWAIDSWPQDDLTVELLATSTTIPEGRIILASFNAG